VERDADAARTQLARELRVGALERVGAADLDPRRCGEDRLRASEAQEVVAPDEDFVQIAAHQVLRSVKRSTFAPRVLR
jgi:hypothetical protein